MDFKKIRKSETTFGGLILSFVVILAIFFGMFAWLSHNVEEVGKPINQTFVDLNESLTESQTAMDNRVTGIQSSWANVTEPDAGIFAVAINGLKGLRNTFGLFIDSIDVFLDTATAFVQAMDGRIPKWAVTVFFLGLLSLIVLLITAILAGASNKIQK